MTKQRILSLLCALAIGLSLCLSFSSCTIEAKDKSGNEEGKIDPTVTEPADEGEESPYAFTVSDAEKTIDTAKTNCAYALLANADTKTILADSGNADAKIYPASMTKIMTLILAIELLEEAGITLDAAFTFNQEMLTPLIEEGASRAGFAAGETVSLLDLLYGAALPSGADATTALAIYIAGSEENFVSLMNDKAKEIGCRATHFMNTNGLHHDNHYTTLREMTMIYAYALQNATFMAVTSARSYQTSPTVQHPRGITLTSTAFSRLDTTGYPKKVTVLSGKTGFTDEAKYCLITYAVSTSGDRYILLVASSTYRGVYAHSSSSGIYQAAYDTVYLYDLLIE